jgi:hypothetical protein
VFSFAGERYDNVLVAATLCTFFKNLDSAGYVKMSREGSKVKSISYDGITLLDVRKLLPAESSLNSFREMTGIKDDEAAKFDFPWDLLDESLAVLDQPELPPDAASWKSRLTGGGPSQERVDELRSSFAKNGHKNCREWLRFYLENDVIMLAKGTQKLFEAYKELFDVQVVDVCKNTVSSLSFYAGQMHLYRKKAPGMFAVNNRKTYAALRRGIRGGVTFASRTFGGEDADPKDFVRLFREQRASQEASGHPGLRPDLQTDEEIASYLNGINSHLLPSGESPLQARFSWYGDINSLYLHGEFRRN